MLGYEAAGPASERGQLVRENRLRAIWGDGGTVLNGWVHIPSPFSAEVLAHSGLDSLTVDMQHGPVDYADLVTMLQAISTTDTVPVVRAPWHDPGLVMRALDAGAYGVICPMVDTPGQAESFVGACRYPPAGYRSYGPFRAAIYGGEDYTEHANRTVVTIAMIETREALENLDGILAVDGLDGVFVGPSDLGQSLGYGPGADRDEPEVVEAIDTVVSTARERGLAAGIFTGTPEHASRMIGKGFNFVNVSTDVQLLAAASAEVVTQLKGE